MTSDEKKRLEKQIQEQGYKQSAYDPNEWLKDGKSSVKVNESGISQGGNKRYGYGNSSDYIDKKG